MEETLYINDKYELIIKTEINKEYKAKTIFDKVRNHFNLPKDIKLLTISKREINFIFEKKEITFYIHPTKCFLEDEKISTVIYSLDHLKLIIKKLNYKKPILFYPEKNQKIILDDNNLNNDIQIDLENNVIIKKNNFLEEKIKSKYNEQAKLLDEYKLKECRCDYFSYKIISVNIKQYFKSLKEESLEEPFYYYTSKKRLSLEEDLKKFIKNKIESIFPIVGPYGIGKSLTALILQKNLFTTGIKCLYINIKYYCQEIPYVNKLDTLMNECFYLCSNEEEYIWYHKLFQDKNSSNIWELLKIIYDNIKDYTNFLFILDQYKASYDPQRNIFSYPKIHIFLISSINDKDIKSDIISLLKNEEPKIKYNYLFELLENDYLIDIYKMNQKRLLKTITEENNINDKNNNNNIDMKSNINNISNDNINNNIIINNMDNDNNEDVEKIVDNSDKIKTIETILNSFGFLPGYISLLLNKYKNIYDFSNEEYIKIFRGYKKFFKVNDISKFQNLSKEYINNIYINITTFIDNLQYIPLKYVNYEKSNYKNYYLKYAFPLCKEIYDVFYIYDSDRTKFITDDEDGCNIFERYLRITLRCCDKLKIDGYFEVNTIVDLQLTDYYKNLNNSYFLNKANILIAQKDRSGKNFDFCIFKPDIKALILIKVKYCIKNNNAHQFSYYAFKYSTSFKNKFEKRFNTKIDKVYLLYFSSYHYNIKRKREVLKILKNNKLTCLFFNVDNLDISFDFKNNINSIPLSDSFILYPNKQNYIPQWNEGNEELSSKIPNFLNKKKFMTNKINYYNKGEIGKFSLEDIYYEKFIEHIKKYKLINEDILQYFDKFIQIYINSFGKSEYIPDGDLYIFVFELNNVNINFNGKLGLVYIDNLDEITFFDINNKTHLKEEDFCTRYENCCYAIGKYTKN